jgi:2-amino-4-hydroxy-6-hydroxymethyldihydropteridine diphosphokinase
VVAWIGLGGNFVESGTLIAEALRHLDASDDTSVLRQSAIYTSPPWGLSGQSDFVNAVAEIETSLGPTELLNHLLALENSLGRDRQIVRWGPRCIDLDLLTFDELKLETSSLTLPHPRMHLRAFVLKPILSLEPDFSIPGIGKALQALEALDPREVGGVQLLSSHEQETEL